MVVPTSRRRHPPWTMTSGTRNAPPISTSSPRLTTTSRPRASAARARRTAAALLFTTSPASAPVNSHSRPRTRSWRCPLAPRSRSYSRLQYPAARPMASTASHASGARPRLVWRTTPAALTTGWNLGSDRARASPSARPASAPAAVSSSDPPSTRPLTSSSTARAASAANPLGTRPSATASRRTGSCRRRSTAGILLSLARASGARSRLTGRLPPGARCRRGCARSCPCASNR